jgi:hypothetical protein
LGVGVLLLLFWKEFQLLSFDRAFGASLGWPMQRLDIGFTLLVVAAIVLGLQSVGVVLMSALSVAPAAAACQWVDGLGAMVLLAAVLGAVAGVSGTLLSAALGWAGHRAVDRALRQHPGIVFPALGAQTGPCLATAGPLAAQARSGKAGRPGHRIPTALRLEIQLIAVTAAVACALVGSSGLAPDGFDGRCDQPYRAFGYCPELFCRAGFAFALLLLGAALMGVATVGLGRGFAAEWPGRRRCRHRLGLSCLVQPGRPVDWPVRAERTSGCRCRADGDGAGTF